MFIDKIIKYFLNLNLNLNLKGLLVGVDARKTFDSIDRGYMLKVPEANGFGPKFINWVKKLNKNLKGDVLVNGFKTDKINIEQ